jgi:hypothetical protein
VTRWTVPVARIVVRWVAGTASRATKDVFPESVSSVQDDVGFVHYWFAMALRLSSLIKFTFAKMAYALSTLCFVFGVIGTSSSSRVASITKTAQLLGHDDTGRLIPRADVSCVAGRTASPAILVYE